MPLGFPTRYGSNKPAQLQRLVYVRKFAWCKLGYHTFQIVNSKGADQTAWMRMLVCAFAVHMQQSRSRRGQASRL